MLYGKTKRKEIQQKLNRKFEQRRFLGFKIWCSVSLPM